MQDSARLILLLGRLLLGSVEPSDKGLGTLADGTGGREVAVLLAGLAAPLANELLRDQLLVVELVEDLVGDDIAGQQLGVLLALLGEEALDTTHEGLLVTLRSLARVLGVLEELEDC